MLLLLEITIALIFDNFRVISFFIICLTEVIHVTFRCHKAIIF